jgi:SAM-dependent methyltransferase
MTFDLHALVNRTSPPEPWSEGDKIPWNDPAFSTRMLREHLTQDHDAASRRDETIDLQVTWLDALLESTPSRILDLGCGPGLYAQRLAGRGHRVHGIDFSPASVRHAQKTAASEGLDVTYERGDIRTAEYGDSFELAMLIYGELNVFRRADALAILAKVRAALAPGGWLIVEPHTFEAVRARGHSPQSWYAVESGLFSDRPHVVVEESFWDEPRTIATHRWYVIDTETAAVERHADAMQAYTPAEYVALLEEAGFGSVELRTDWPSAPDQEEILVAYAARAS